MSWASLLSLLPYLFQIIGWIFDKNKADAALKQKFMDMVDAYGKSGLVTIKMKDDFQDMHDKLKARLAAGEKPDDKPPAA